jgi:general stress protein 26
VRSLRKNGSACLYFADDNTFEGLCLFGNAVAHFESSYRELLWNEGDEKYYPLGVDDPDYCVIEFTADRAEYYRYDGKGALDAEAIARIDVGAAYENGYARNSAKEETP